MRTQWIAAALLSSAFIAGCGDKSADNPQNTAQTEGTSVTVPPEAGAESNLQPAPVDQRAASSNRDASRSNPSAVGTTSRATPRAPETTRPEPRPVERVRPEAPQAVAPPAPVVRFVTVPVGTALPLELTTALSSETAQVEMPVTARLRRSVTVDGETALPAGAVVHGEVSDVARAGRVQGRSRLGLRFTSIVIDGRREALRTNPVSFEGEASKGEDAVKIGAGAGIGAAIGGILGGGSGAAKGAAIGGAAGTGTVLATRGKEVELAAGADLAPTLASPVEVQVK